MSQPVLPPANTTEQTFAPYIRLRTEGILGVSERTHTETSQQGTICSLFSERKPHTAVKVPLAGRFPWAAFLEPPKSLTFFLPSLPTLRHCPHSVTARLWSCGELRLTSRVRVGFALGLSTWKSSPGAQHSTAPCRQPLLTQGELLPSLSISVRNLREDYGYQQVEGAKVPLPVLPPITLHVNPNFTLPGLLL